MPERPPKVPPPVVPALLDARSVPTGAFSSEPSIHPDSPDGADPAPARLPLGDLERRYQLGERLGAGGTSLVRVGLCGRLRREVAIKLLMQHSVRAQDRFLAEAQVTAQLEHPNIVPVHDYGLGQDGAPFLAMKRVRGTSLREIVRTRKLSLEARLDVFRKICDAVAFAHSRGVLHRDLKTENVMVGAFGEVHLMDWGLARPADRVEEPQGATDDSLDKELHVDRFEDPSFRTRDGTVMGTPVYMAPEQAEGRLEAQGRHTDVYGLGAILYEILTDRPPFDGPVQAVLVAVRAGNFAAPRKVRPGIPRELEAVVLRAMALQPERRYPSVSALREDIDAFLERRPLVHVRSSPTERLQKLTFRYRSAVRAGILVALLGSLALLLAAWRYTVDVGRARDLAIEESQRARRAEGDALGSLMQARISLADNLWSLGRAQESWTLLRQAERELSLGWDRRPLELALSQWTAQSPPPVARCSLHGGKPVRALALSEEGDRVVSWGEDGRLVDWDVAGCKERRAMLLGGVPGSGAIRWRGDRVEAALMVDSELRLVDLDKGSSLRIPVEGSVAHLGWDGEKLWMDRDDGQGFLYDPATGRLEGSRTAPSGGWWWPVARDRLQVGLSGPTGRALGGVWERTSGRAVWTHELLTTAQTSLDDTLLFWGNSMEMGVQELPSGRTRWSRRHDPITLVGVDPTSTVGWVAGFDGSLELLRLVDGATIANLAGEEILLRSSRDGDRAGFSAHTTAHGRVVAVGGDRGEVAIFLPSTDNPLRPAEGRGALAQGLAVHPSAPLVATGDDEGVLRVLDISTGRTLRRWKASATGVREVAFSPDGRSLAAAVRHEGVAVWDLVSGVERLRVPLEVRSVSLAWSGLETLVVGDAEGNLTRVDLDDSRFTKLGRAVKAGIWDLTPLQDGLVLLAGHLGEEHTLKVVSAENGAVRATRPSDEPIYHHDVAPGGSLVAVARQDGTVLLWDWRSGERRSEIVADSGPTLGVAFSPDGTLLATAGFSRRTQIWDVGTGQLLRSVVLHDGPSVNVAWTPDGSFLLSTGADGLAILPTRAHLFHAKATGDIAGSELERARAFGALGWWERVGPALDSSTRAGGQDLPDLRAHALLALGRPWHGGPTGGSLVAELLATMKPSDSRTERSIP